jgi:hypothetical protein
MICMNRSSFCNALFITSIHFPAECPHPHFLLPCRVSEPFIHSQAMSRPADSANKVNPAAGLAVPAEKEKFVID